MQLYEKITTGKRVSYKLYEPTEEPTVLELTDKQMLTVAGALGATLLMLYERFLPPHKRLARKVKGLEAAILDLYAGTGEAVDHETLEWFLKMWNATMANAEKGAIND